ncbi:MAG: transposase [Pyrinomonadaceae bacterium]
MRVNQRVEFLLAPWPQLATARRGIRSASPRCRGRSESCRGEAAAGRLASRPCSSAVRESAGSGDARTATRWVADACRAHGISEQTYHRWKAKYGGPDVNEARRLKSLEDENRRLKAAVADLTLDNRMLKDVLAKKW